MSEAAPGSRPGFVVRHWRGDEPLGEAFWRNGLGLGLLLALIEMFVTVPLAGSGSIQLFRAILIGVLLVNGAFAVWASVGIWRSADRHWISPATAIAAKVVVIISVAFLLLHATMLTMAMTGFLAAPVR